MDWAIYGTLIVQQWPAAMTPAGLSKGQLFFLCLGNLLILSSGLAKVLRFILVFEKPQRVYNR